MQRPTLHFCARWAAPLAAGLLLSACGTPSGGAAAATVAATAAATPSDAGIPTMVMLPMFALAKPSMDLRITAGHAVMVMAISRDGRPHAVRSAVPLTALQVQDPGVTTVVPPTPDRAAGFAVLVAADHEVDLMFVPDTPGRFPIEDGGTQVAVLVVGSSAG